MAGRGPEAAKGLTDTRSGGRRIVTDGDRRHAPIARIRDSRRSSEPPVVVREYGRDSLLVCANLLIAPLFGALGFRIGLRSEDRLAATMQAEAAAMRKKGYAVAVVETRSLPVLGSRSEATWYRVTYERIAPAAKGGDD